MTTPFAKHLPEQDVKAFQRDGVILIKNAFEPRWLSQLHAGIKRDLKTPTPRLERHSAEDAPAHYWEDFWAWSLIPEFEDFLRASPAAGLAAQLLAAQRINLVMDNWFLREAGSAKRAPWHHDIAYFDFEGSMCVLWLPLEPVSRDNTISFVRGSHLWGKLFQRVFFRDHSTSDEAGWVKGQFYEPPPDIEANPEDYDLVAFDMTPGDCLFFDMRTLHGARGNTVTEKTARRFTLRMAKEDSRIRYRGDWTKGERALIEAAGHKEGDALNSDFFPMLWEASARL